jgi:hypothetical protein
MIATPAAQWMWRASSLISSLGLAPVANATAMKFRNG